MRLPVLAALALITTAVPATAAPRLDGVPTHVRAGTDLRITWTGLGPEAHEAELELSLAGGRWVRISPEMEAIEGGFTWHVPAGLSGPARLRLKYGGEWFEAEGPVSTPFVIEPDAGAPVTLYTDPGLGEWWWLGPYAGALPLRQLSSAASYHAVGCEVGFSPEPDGMSRPIGWIMGRATVREPSSARGELVPRRGSVARSYPLRI